MFGFVGERRTVMIVSRRKSKHETAISIVDERLLAVALKLFWLWEELPGRSARRSALLNDLDEVVEKHFDLAAATSGPASERHRVRRADARTRIPVVATSECQ
jgi:hypothetical protein